MDPILFIATLVAMVTNLLGVRDVLVAAMEDVGEHAEFVARRLRIWLTKRIAGPIATFMNVSAGGMLVIFGIASLIHFRANGLTFIDGHYPAFFLASLAAILGTVAWAHVQREAGDDRPILDARGEPIMEVVGTEPVPPGQEGPPEPIWEPKTTFQPKRVKFFMSGFVLMAAVAAMSITLRLHALTIGSRGMWLTAMLASYAGIVIVAAVGVVLSWIVLRGGGFLERALQLLVEQVAPLLGGITFKNVREKLFPNGLNLIEEERSAAVIGAVAGALFAALAPYDLIVLIWPTPEVAVYVLFPYVATGIAALAAYRRLNLRKKVDESSDHFYWMVFRLVPIALLVVPLFAVVLRRRAWAIHSWIVDVVNGDVYLFMNHGWRTPLLGILIFLVMLFIGKALLAKSESGFAKWLLFRMPLVGLLFSVVYLMVAISGEPGWSPWAVSDKAIARASMVSGSRPTAPFIAINKTKIKAETTVQMTVVQPPPPVKPQIVVVKPVKKAPPPFRRAARPRTDAEAEAEFDALAESYGVEPE
jgi:hypothetical protein